MLSQNPSHIPSRFYCDKCNYGCSKKGDFNKHINSIKHNAIHATSNATSHLLICGCGKDYKHRSSFYRHKKNCTLSSPPLENTFIPNSAPETAMNEPTSAELVAIIKQLVIQNATTTKHVEQLQTTMKEMIPLLGNNNTTNTNSNNTFNVQMFLDNQCKDAMSIQDFVNSIELNMSHMLAISKDGYVDSISNVLIDSLNKLKLTDRPLHCTDLKRETIYIKDQEAWNKSTADAPLMNRVITNIEDKHYALVGEYVREHPRTNDVDSPECTLYTKACINSLGNGEDHCKLNKKIYKKILPTVKLEKEMI